MKESDCEIVYSGKDPGKFRKDKPPVWLFRTPNRLKEKLQGGDFEFSSEFRRRAWQDGDDYSDWVKETITDLVGAHEEAQNSFGKAEEQMKGAMEKINILAHELRGQGGIFGYPLISEFGKSLYNCTGNSARVTENLLEFVKAHIDGITAVINGNVKGDGGPVGKELLSSLEAAKKKYSGRTGKGRLSRRAIRIQSHQISREIACGECAEVFDAFADTDRADRQAESIRECDEHAAFRCAV